MATKEIAEIVAVLAKGTESGKVEWVPMARPGSVGARMAGNLFTLSPNLSPDSIIHAISFRILDLSGNEVDGITAPSESPDFDVLEGLWSAVSKKGEERRKAQLGPILEKLRGEMKQPQGAEKG